MEASTTVADVEALERLFADLGLSADENASCREALQNVYNCESVVDLRHHYRREGDAVIGYMNFPKARQEALAALREELSKPAVYLSQAELQVAVELCSFATFVYQDRAFLKRVEEFCDKYGVTSIDFSETTGETKQKSVIAILPIEEKQTVLWAFAVPRLAGDRIKDLDVLPAVCDKFCGRVQDNLLRRSEEQLVEAVVRAAATLGARRIVTCGHSYGGAVAHLVALQILKDQDRYHDSYKPGEEGVSSVSFGAPLYADEGVANACAERKWEGKLVHIVRSVDPLPMLNNVGEAIRAYLQENIGGLEEEAFKALGIINCLPDVVRAYVGGVEELAVRSIRRGKDAAELLEANGELLAALEASLIYRPVGLFLFVDGDSPEAGVTYEPTIDKAVITERLDPFLGQGKDGSPVASMLTDESQSAHLLSSYARVLQAPFRGCASTACVQDALQPSVKSEKQHTDLVGTGEGAFNSIMTFEVRQKAVTECCLNQQSRVYAIPCTNGQYVQPSGVEVDYTGPAIAWRKLVDVSQPLQVVTRGGELWIVEQLVPDAEGWDSPPDRRIRVRVRSSTRDVRHVREAGDVEVYIEPRHCRVVKNTSGRTTPTWRSWLDDFFLLRLVKMSWALCHHQELLFSRTSDGKTRERLQQKAELPKILDELQDIISHAADVEDYFDAEEMPALRKCLTLDLSDPEKSFDAVGHNLFPILRKAIAWLAAEKGLKVASDVDANRLLESSSLLKGKDDGPAAVAQGMTVLGLLGTPSHPPVVPLKSALRIWLQSDGVPFVYTSAADAGEDCANAYVDFCGQLLNAARRVEQPTFGYTCEDLEHHVCALLARFSDLYSKDRAGGPPKTGLNLDSYISLLNRTDREFPFQPFHSSKFNANMLPWSSLDTRTRRVVEEHVNAIRLIHKLRKMLDLKVVAVIGRQDVGKTTMVNQLRRAMDLEGVAEPMGHDVHTLSTKVYKLSDECILLDTPGVDSVQQSVRDQFVHTARIVADVFLYIRQGVSDFNDHDIEVLTQALDVNGFQSRPHICICMNKIGSSLEHVDGVYTKEELEGMIASMRNVLRTQYTLSALNKFHVDLSRADGELADAVEQFVHEKMKNVQFVYTDLLFDSERLRAKGIEEITWTAMEIATYLEAVLSGWDQADELTSMFVEEGSAKEEATLRVTMAMQTAASYWL